MTPLTEQARTALRERDLRWLTAHLDSVRQPPDALVAALVRHEDVRLRHLGLSHLAAWTARPGVDESELRALAPLLPEALDGPPETWLLLATLYQRLGRQLPDPRRPDWRSAELPVPVQIAWLRAEILQEPAILRHEPTSELLYQAVEGIAAADAYRPEQLIRELVERDDPVLHGTALRLIREFLHGTLLAPAQARGYLSRLVDAGNVAVPALGELAQPWAALGPLPPEGLRPLLAVTTPPSGADTSGSPSNADTPESPSNADTPESPGEADTSESPDPALVDAALLAAARHGHAELLWTVFTDPVMPPRSRQRALATLGDLAVREDIEDVVGIAGTDPLLFGGPAIRCLRALHRRGIFPHPAVAPAIVHLALADHTIPATEVATIVFTSRREACAALLPPEWDEETSARRLDLLVALAGQGDDDLPIGPAVTRGLIAARRPDPFLAAIRALRYSDAEAAVIDALPLAPEAALDTLAAIGGPRTVAALTERLGGPADPGTAADATDTTPATGGAAGPVAGAAPAAGSGTADRDPVAGDSDIVPYLRPVRHRALELVWHLTDQPRQRRALLARLNPRDVPARIASDLGGPDRAELALLTADLDPERPVEALRTLATNGDADVVPVIAGILLRIVADLAASRQPGGPPPPGGIEPTGTSGAGRPAGEPEVPDEVRNAIRALGQRLHARGRIRPICLLDAATADDAGDALVASIALDLLARHGLSDGERAILLALLGRARHAGTRVTIQRLLWHRERHVRRQAFTLLAAGPDEDTEALSASLIALVGDPDGETVRQTLLALGRIRARWAAPAIAAGLDHPAMSVKRIAASALVRAGTPGTVPKLLAWLARHDNPGLRTTLVAALRAILGDAYAATVLAAAEESQDDRSRTFLLHALDRELSARAVDALAEQGSPVAETLLTLVATGGLALGVGRVADLGRQLRAYGIAVPADRPAAEQSIPEVEALVRAGWDAEIAVRIADRYAHRPDRLTVEDRGRLRPMLASWLHLARDRPASRPAILRLALGLCPAPWSPEELSAFAGAIEVLLTALSPGTGPVPASHRPARRTGPAPSGGGPDRDGVLAVLAEVAPTLRPAEALDLATRLRALPPEVVGESRLDLLRASGAVLTRTDVERALGAARLGPDPWRTEVGILRGAFLGTGRGPVPPPRHGTERDRPGGPAADHPDVVAWRHELDRAVRRPDTLAEFRARDASAIPARHRLDGLIEAFPSAAPEVRGALLDWLEAVQPVGAPPWTRAEAARSSAPTPRTPQLADLDQPRSAAQRDRLLAMLDAPSRDRRNAAATRLAHWPEPEIRRALLRAFLAGRVDMAVTAGLVESLATIDLAELPSGGAGTETDAERERVARIAGQLGPADLHRLTPWLLECWEHGAPGTRQAVEQALRQVPGYPDLLVESLRGRLQAGSWGFVDLIAGRPLLRTPALVALRERLRAEQGPESADRLVLVPGPLDPDRSAGPDLGALLARRTRPKQPDGPSRHELVELVRTGHPEQARRALTRLAEIWEDDRGSGSRPADDPGLRPAALLAELIRHPDRRLRAQAHRIGRRVLDRTPYLEQSAVMLDDVEPEIVRSAVKALCHAAYRPAIPAVVDLLTHSDPRVRRASADGLRLFGPAAVPALRYAAGHARPDRRHHYVALLDQLDTVA